MRGVEAPSSISASVDQGGRGEVGRKEGKREGVTERVRERVREKEGRKEGKE